MNHPFFTLKDILHGQQKYPLNLILSSSEAYFFIGTSEKKEVPWLRVYTFVISKEGSKASYCSFCLSPKLELSIFSIM